MIYSYPYTISISRSGPDNQLTPACAMDLLQDCATLHTMAAGAGPDKLKQQHIAWVANSWNIYFDKPCHFEDTLQLATWAPNLIGCSPIEIAPSPTPMGNCACGRIPCGF